MIIAVIEIGEYGHGKFETRIIFPREDGNARLRGIFWMRWYCYSEGYADQFILDGTYDEYYL